MKTIMTTPVIDLSGEAPEWAVAVGYTVNGNPEYPDRICVWQNGALVVDAVNDIPTYDALTDLTRKANQHAAILAALERADSALFGFVSSTANRSLHDIRIEIQEAIRANKY